MSVSVYHPYRLKEKCAHPASAAQPCFVPQPAMLIFAPHTPGTGVSVASVPSVFPSLERLFLNLCCSACAWVSEA